MVKRETALANWQRSVAYQKKIPKILDLCLRMYGENSDGPVIAACPFFLFFCDFGRQIRKKPAAFSIKTVAWALPVIGHRVVAETEPTLLGQVLGANVPQNVLRVPVRGMFVPIVFAPLVIEFFANTRGKPVALLGLGVPSVASAWFFSVGCCTGTGGGGEAAQKRSCPLCRHLLG